MATSFLILTQATTFAINVSKHSYNSTNAIFFINMKSFSIKKFHRCFTCTFNVCDKALAVSYQYLV